MISRPTKNGFVPRDVINAAKVFCRHQFTTCSVVDIAPDLMRRQSFFNVKGQVYQTRHLIWIELKTANKTREQIELFVVDNGSYVDIENVAGKWLDQIVFPV